MLLDMSDLGSDFVEAQVGGGCRANVSPPPALTPTHLQTFIKATNQDGGLISKARLRRTEQTNQATSGPFVDDNPFLPSPEIRCASELFQSTEDVMSVDRFLMPPSCSPAASGMIDFPYLLSLFFLLRVDIQALQVLQPRRGSPLVMNEGSQ